jgi:hypothetical protein
MPRVARFFSAFSEIYAALDKLPQLAVQRPFDQKRRKQRPAAEFRRLKESSADAMTPL